RQWQLLRTLSARRLGASVQEMAAELSVTEKTIRRDLATFQLAGFPLIETVGDRGRKNWRVRTAGDVPEIGFTLDEALALYLGRRLLDPLAGTVVGEAAQRAFAKVRACLGKAALQYVERLAAHLHVTPLGAGDYARQREHLNDLLAAVADSLQTVVSYQSARATEPVEYQINPLGIAQHRGSLYVVAWSHDHGEVRTFKLDRIDAVEVSGLPFQRPAGFDVRQYLSGSFGVFHAAGDVAVRVRFAPAVARYVQEGRWHASQRLTPQKDGSLLADFRLSGFEEIKRWLLSFGKHAEVLEPPILREELEAEISAMVQLYLAERA
ncbi:MAG: WYL domain-containing protein, partial [Planctomycetia bacterium]|nr:WYL domain-containing protein [Planctomycetia bacterium]